MWYMNVARLGVGIALLNMKDTNEMDCNQNEVVLKVWRLSAAPAIDSLYWTVGCRCAYC
jgi:hypothetical protein